MQHEPDGISSQQMAQLGAYSMYLRSVPLRQDGLPSCQCSQPGCQVTAVVECRDCQLGGCYLCEQHDRALHSQAHFHRRCGLVMGFKQPLRPTQLLYNAEQKSWQDVPLSFELAPCEPCSCGNTQWQSVEVGKKMILVTAAGKADQGCISNCVFLLLGAHNLEVTCRAQQCMTWLLYAYLSSLLACGVHHSIHHRQHMSSAGHDQWMSTSTT